MKKSLLSLGAIGLLSLTLVSCDSSINTTVAYGDLSSTKSYASANGKTLSEKQLYDLMRNEGYSAVKENIKEQLFSDVLPKYENGVLKNTTYFDYNPDSTDEDVLSDTYAINANVVGRLYGASTVEAFKALTEKDKKTALTRCVDTLLTTGVRKDDGTPFTYADLASYEIEYKVDSLGNDVFYAKFPYQLYKTYIYSRATENYALKQLKNPDFKYYYKNKYVKNHGTNSFYVEDEDIVNYYYSTGKAFGKYRGIIMEFSSQAYAERIMNSAIGSTVLSDDKDTALSQYVSIYNLRYTTRDDLDADTILTDRYTNLSISYKKNNMSVYQSAIQDMFRKEMADGEYLKSAFNIGGKYYLVYRISGDDEVEWSALSENDKNPDIEDSVYNDMLDCILRSKSLSSLVSIIEKERFDAIVDEKAIEIYDPIYAVKFDADYSDYKMSKASSSDYVYKFTYDGNEYTMTPSELYDKLEPLYGTTTAVEYFKDQWLLSLDDVRGLINKDDFSDIDSDIASEIKSFKKGKKSYSSKIGTAAYLQLTYGYSTKKEVIDSKYADVIQTKLSSFFGDFSNADETANTDATLFKNFASIYKSVYDKYFDVSVSHILVGLDVDGTGSYTNPNVYRDSLPASLQTKFDESLMRIVNAIISEVKILTTSMDVKEALSYVSEAFTNNYKIGSLSYETGSDVYWSDYKNEFPFAMKAEDLSSIDLFKASSYMEEFSDRAKELYDKVKDGTIDEKDVEDKGVFEFDTLFTSAADMYDALCVTSYGYHILNVYKIGDATSAVFKSTSDSKVEDSDEYKQYEKLKVVIIADDQAGKKDDNDDPEYVLYTNGYSDYDYASASQLFVYFYEHVVVGSHSLLKTSVRSAISTMFDQALSFYTNSSFQEWIMLHYYLSDLTFDAGNTAYDMYVTSKENGLYSYQSTDYTLFRDFIDGTYNWELDYSWNH